MINSEIKPLNKYSNSLKFWKNKKNAKNNFKGKFKVSKSHKINLKSLDNNWKRNANSMKITKTGFSKNIRKKTNS